MMLRYFAAFMHDKSHLMATLNFNENIYSNLPRGESNDSQKISPFSYNWVVSIKFMHHMTNAETIIELPIQRETFPPTKCPQKSRTFVQTSTIAQSLLCSLINFLTVFFFVPLDDEILLFYASTEKPPWKIFSFSFLAKFYVRMMKKKGGKKFRCIY